MGLAKPETFYFSFTKEHLFFQCKFCVGGLIIYIPQSKLSEAFVWSYVISLLCYEAVFFYKVCSYLQSSNVILGGCPHS